jgi:hypothetical protein
MVEAKRKAKQASEELKHKTEAVATLLETTTEVNAKVSPARGNGDTMYQGMIELDIVAVNPEQIASLLSQLREIKSLQVVSLSGKDLNAKRVVIVVDRALPLLRTLRELPTVDTAEVNGTSIRLTLQN